MGSRKPFGCIVSDEMLLKRRFLNIPSGLDTRKMVTLTKKLVSSGSRTLTTSHGQRRLLLINGHNSHYSLEFLEYAIAALIFILCYPSHATHVYQGLDVVIFGTMKTAWQRARDEYERKTGNPVNKTNFLSVYATAHQKTLVSRQHSARQVFFHSIRELPTTSLHLVLKHQQQPSCR